MFTPTIYETVIVWIVNVVGVPYANIEEHRENARRILQDTVGGDTLRLTLHIADSLYPSSVITRLNSTKPDLDTNVTVRFRVTAAQPNQDTVEASSGW